MRARTCIRSSTSTSTVPGRATLPARTSTVRTDERHERVMMEPKRHYRTTRRRGLRLSAYALACASVGVIAGPAIANRVVGHGRAAQSLPPTLGVDLSRAQRVVSVGTGGGSQASAWTAPTTTGYRCVFLQLSGGATPDTFSGNGGGACQRASEPQPPRSRSITVQMIPTVLDGRATVLLVGTTAPASCKS